MRLKQAPCQYDLDEVIIDIETRYLRSLPPFDRYSDSMQKSLRRTLDDLELLQGEEERTRFLVRAFYYFLQEIRSDRKLGVANIQSPGRRSSISRSNRCHSSASFSST